jgi:hypothetical protein
MTASFLTLSYTLSAVILPFDAILVHSQVLTLLLKKLNKHGKSLQNLLNCWSQIFLKMGSDISENAFRGNKDAYAGKCSQ